MRIRILALLLSASTLPTAGGLQAAPGTAPDMDAYWRTFFARPTGAPPAPDSNPLTSDKARLGEKLFSDPRLSGDGTRACVFCHHPDKAFSDGRARGLGLDGKPLRRNVPTLLGLAWSRSFMWDGRAPSLEEQAAMPLLDRNEMAGDWRQIIMGIKRDPPLDVEFHVAFKERPAGQPATILAALASYVRTLVPPEAPFDAWVKGDERALTEEEKAGFRLFVGKAGCVGCHAGWRFTDDKFHDIGLRGDDPGRGAVAGGIKGLAAFKTPTLRELPRTAPFMHDGSLATIEDVIDHYAGKLEVRPSLDSSVVRGLRLEPTEKAALTAFLRALSSRN